MNDGKTHKTVTPQSMVQCYRCRKVGHYSNHCTAVLCPTCGALDHPGTECVPKVKKTVRCFTCNKDGHYSDKCPDKKSSNCVVCLESSACYTMVPCGHLCVCFKCCQQLRQCPICRTPIKTTVRTFVS
jgi:hypothetical protein